MKMTEARSRISSTCASVCVDDFRTAEKKVRLGLVTVCESLEWKNSRRKACGDAVITDHQEEARKADP